jgi:hypothetical protein
MELTHVIAIFQLQEKHQPMALVQRKPGQVTLRHIQANQKRWLQYFFIVSLGCD